MDEKYQIKLTQDEFERVNLIKSDLNKDKESKICPGWDCIVCTNLFPNRSFNCPCSSIIAKELSLSHVKDVLTQIINYNTNLEEKKS